MSSKKRPTRHRPKRTADKPKVPRVMVTLDWNTYNSIKRLSRASGMSMSSYISQLMQEANPTTDLLAQVFEDAREDSSQAAGKLVDLMHRQMRTAAQHTLDLQQKVKDKGSAND